MRIEIGWVPRLLGRSSARSLTINGESVVVVSRKGSANIPLHSIERIASLRGLIWSSLTIKRSDGQGPVLVGGLKPNDADAVASLTSAFRSIGTIRSAIADFKALCDQDAYLTHRSYLAWLKKHGTCANGITFPLDRLELPAELKDDVNRFRAILREGTGIFAKRNDLYAQRLLTKHGHWFDTLERFPLTPRQREAIVHDEDNCLVVAGAGTGKTSTVMGKVGFVLELKQAAAGEILLLAFTQKAKTEMEERIKARFAIDLEARTFHGLGLEIIAKVEGRKPSLAKWATETGDLDELLQGFISQLLRDPKYGPLLHRYLAYYLAAYKPPEQFQTLHEYAKYMNSQDIRTLKGESVQSFEEVMIANWLFLNGIEYEYEAKYCHDTATIEHRQYTPDFYLPDHDLYIEHFGVDRQGHTAPWIDASEYAASMAWKRSTHKRYKTKLIETYSYERREGKLLQSLETKLRQQGITPNPISQDEVNRTLQKGGYITRLSKLLGTFLGHFKSNQHQLGDLRTKAKGLPDPDRSLAFLDVFEVVVGHYETKLQKTGDIDFHDMIAKATGYVQSGKYVSAFKYVIVDEFQDISVGRYRLLKALLEHVADRHLFCVGDDWQSIYRFTGSDISLMTSFQDRFGFTRTTPLDRTFRFDNRLCEFGTKFILKNTHQIAKRMETQERAENAAVQVVTVPAIGRSEDILKRILEDVRRRCAGKEASVFMLGRFWYGRPENLSEIEREFPEMTITYMTAHAAKGLEADFVLVLNVVSGKYGFPCEIEDDPLLDLVLAADSGYPNAEERRLFYVAVTRARKRTYVVTAEGQRSSFIDEIEQAEYAELVSSDRRSLASVNCPQCNGGTMLRRESKSNTFWGCSNYPYCEATFELCPGCKQGAIIQQGGKARCANPTCTHIPRLCPQCHTGMLVQRKGKYGAFLGCSNFSKGCRYTQKIR